MLHYFLSKTFWMFVNLKIGLMRSILFYLGFTVMVEKAFELFCNDSKASNEDNFMNLTI